MGLIQQSLIASIFFFGQFLIRDLNLSGTWMHAAIKLTQHFDCVLISSLSVSQCLQLWANLRSHLFSTLPADGWWFPRSEPKAKGVGLPKKCLHLLWLQALARYRSLLFVLALIILFHCFYFWWSIPFGFFLATYRTELMFSKQEELYF